MSSHLYDILNNFPDSVPIDRFKTGKKHLANMQVKTVGV